MAELKPTEVITAPVRLAFPALFEPRPVAKGSETLKYMATALLPPGFDMKPLLNAARAAMTDKWGANLPKIPAKNNPIKSCDDREINGYEPGWFYINAKSNYPPSVVDQKRNEINDPEQVFPGCWVRMHLKAYAFDHPQGGKGVSFGLNGVQLVRSDERLDGRRSAQEVFDELEVPNDEAFGGTTAGGGDPSSIFGD